VEAKAKGDGKQRKTANNEIKVGMDEAKNGSEKVKIPGNKG